MEAWIDRIEFDRIEVDEPGTVRIEGGFDSFERIDIRESDEDESDTHIFKINKETDLFNITINWAIDPEGEEYSENKLKELAKNRIRTESSYQASHYLKSMDLPPLQGLFAEEMVVEMVPEPEELDDD
jgi:hypothetical protein